MGCEGDLLICDKRDGNLPWFIQGELVASVLVILAVDGKYVHAKTL